ncbi:hypothetical protein SAPIO_CDS4405 [Scedosporium apiospermum]|uniref:Cyanate hydratase n=1 Tax=Pseudallescheria apiosperma TaxID=563466 RepID=A0A084G847_PSEDA|nr:uncharacterized protein SAPIO_CDS4405 [Scedosporium apiospermum]KEZ43509.1 hypothetical protein SAPIO_CDS4405 [Scedosporium apiospermum]
MSAEETRIAIPNSVLLAGLPPHCSLLFSAKAAKALTFADLATRLNRSEVSIAALFYGQLPASPADVDALSAALDIPRDTLLQSGVTGFPDRGRVAPMPPSEPFVYRLYEIVRNYGYAFKAVVNEKFGDGIMSAIAFSSKVEKEEDENGTWVVITLRGKWLPFSRW